MRAREEILDRIRLALADVPAGERPEDVDLPCDYLGVEPGDAVERFVERVSDYRATVRRAAAGEVAAAVAAVCRERGVSRLAVPGDLPREWEPQGVELARSLTVEVLDAVDGALTGCAAAIAETGTIVLDAGPRQGPRALTLVPDLHVCVVEASQVVGGVPEAASLIAATLREAGRPVTLISGPSATSDIELSRVEGVHGPRTLELILVTGGPGAA